MTPTTKWILKAVGVGLYVTLSALATTHTAGVELGWSELEDAVIAGGLGLLGFLGLAKTPLENPGGEK